MGYFAKNGSYVIDWKKVRTYAVPENLKDFKVGYQLHCALSRLMDKD